ncbi:MAG: hypothetical protein IPO56_16135 [Flavobacteriales bacterium]|nr:hypothetical protein [Flavobacteriales bacterium]
MKYLLEKAAIMSGPTRVFGRMFRSLAAKSRVIGGSSDVEQVKTRDLGPMTGVAKDVSTDMVRRTGNRVASTGAFAVKSPRNEVEVPVLIGVFACPQIEVQ